VWLKSQYHILTGAEIGAGRFFFEKKLNFPPFSHLLHPNLDRSALIISALYYTNKTITDQKPFVIYSKKRYISYNLVVILLTISKIYTGINIFNLQH
jgi:hypothetical protein